MSQPSPLAPPAARFAPLRALQPTQGTIMRTILLTALSIAAAVLLLACEDPKSSQFVEPVYQDPCGLVNCGQGMCAVSTTGIPECLCNVGYVGSTCASCEVGFHRDALMRCVSDRLCADQPSDPCGEGGHCQDGDGVIACECDTGYEGPRCTLCADRYARDELDRCLPLFLGGGTGGAAGGGMLDAGSSKDAGPSPMTCGPGYTGASCELCTAGYHKVADSCVLDESCRPTSCPAHATCSLVAGMTQCTCAAGYTDASCASCAPAYHREGDVCLPDQTCEPATCPQHATCAVNTGKAVCTCTTGYQGDVCASCVPGYVLKAGECVLAPVTCDVGYHKVGNSCVVDEFCQINSCAGHASCAVVSGLISCSCNGGWGPVGACNVCSSYATERAGFEYPDWTKTINTCGATSQLMVSRVSFVSRKGPNGPEGKVLECAPSTYSMMTTQHIQLQAYLNRPAVLTFEQGAILIAFDYGTSVQPLAVDVFAHDNPTADLSTGGRKVGALTLTANSRATFTIPLDPAARAISLRSRDGKLQEMALDDLVYSYPDCK